MSETGTGGKVEEIFMATVGGEDMKAVEEVLAEEGRGLKGDRYAERTGYWTGVDECEVTLIEREDLDFIAESTGLNVCSGEHRRNIITSGIRLQELRGKRFQVGETVLEFDRPRPPCSYIQKLTGQQGLTKALGGTRGGICARVVKGGAIRPGDSVRVL